MRDLINQTLKTQASGLEALVDTETVEEIERAAELIHGSDGRVILTGIGKSGDIAKKISSTLSSIGESSFFIHPVEAQHGDLGAISAADTLILLSNSGNTTEVVEFAFFAGRFDVQTVAITSDSGSELADVSDVHIDTRVSEEGALVDLVPMASTTVTMAIGDAIANAIMSLNEFDAERFAHYHPGGTIGKRLLLTVEDVMYTDLPTVNPDETLLEAVSKMSQGGKGIIVVTDENRELVGVITDGDLRRLVESSLDFRESTVGETMTRDPVTIEPSAAAVRALDVLDEYGITQVVVADDDRFEGIVHFHDLVSEGIT